MSASPELKTGERFDALGVRGWQVIQRDDEFRFSLDAVLLAHFATGRSDSQAVDLGTGTGAVALFLLSRGVPTVTGIEINPRLAELATRTAALNELGDRLKIVCCDVNQVKSRFSAGQFDLVTANPPYRLPDTGRISPHEGVALARHETTAGLREFLRAGAFLLRNRGRLAMIHLPERLAELCEEMRSAGVEPKRTRFVHPFLDRAAKMVLMEGVKGARTGLEVLPPLVVYQSQGVYQPEILAYYE